jgi:hypothetical protein
MLSGDGRNPRKRSARFGQGRTLRFQFALGLGLAADGTLLFFTNYRSRTVEVLSVAKLRP